MNLFALFDLPETPVVRVPDLTDRYLRLQRKYHPDHQSSSDGDANQWEAMELSAMVNKAYRIFRNDMEALAYFLELKNKLGGEEKVDLSPSFLAQMMDLNEELENGNTLAYQEGVKAMIQELDQTVSDLMTDQRIDFSATDLDRLTAYYFRKKYIDRLLERYDH
jgi:molecular chaperone HscB